jgi:hypothetical protein
MRGKGVSRLVEVAAGVLAGAGADLGFPEAVGDEVDDALLGLEGPGDAQKVAVLARTAC